MEGASHTCFPRIFALEAKGRGSKTGGDLPMVMQKVRDRGGLCALGCSGVGGDCGTGS